MCIFFLEKKKVTGQWAGIIWVSTMRAISHLKGEDADGLDWWGLS